MESLTYLLKVSACTVLFFGFYLLVLRKLTFFKINRFYLLLTLFLSFIIPAFQYQLIKPIAPVRVPLVQAEQMETFPPVNIAERQVDVVREPIAEKIDYLNMIDQLYIAVAAVLMAICCYRLLRLMFYARKYSASVNGLKLIEKSEGFTNCSFFNYVFIDQGKLERHELDVILRHEAVHAMQLHSVDKILLMVFKSVLWFNPLVYLYDKALEQVHEYEADEMTSNWFGNQAYASLLLKLAINNTAVPLVHNFVKSPIKDRIKMLFHSKSKNMQKLMYLLVLPVMFGLFWLFAVEVVYADQKIEPDGVVIVARESKIPYAGTHSILKKVDGNMSPRNTRKGTFSVQVKPLDEQAPVPVTADGFRDKSATDTIRSIKPKIISFSKITGDVKNKISYLQQAVIAVYNGVLEAEYVVYDEANQKITAKNAVFTKASEHFSIKSALILFDLDKRSFSFDNGKENEQGNRILKNNDEGYQTEDKWAYSAKDSVKMNQDKSEIMLYGQAKVENNNFAIMADEIAFNKKKQTVTAKNLSLKNKDTGITVTGYYGKFDMKGKAEIWQANK